MLDNYVTTCSPAASPTAAVQSTSTSAAQREISCIWVPMAAAPAPVGQAKSSWIGPPVVYQWSLVDEFCQREHTNSGLLLHRHHFTSKRMRGTVVTAPRFSAKIDLDLAHWLQSVPVLISSVNFSADSINFACAPRTQSSVPWSFQRPSFLLVVQPLTLIVFDSLWKSFEGARWPRASITPLRLLWWHPSLSLLSWFCLFGSVRVFVIKSR